MHSTFSQSRIYISTPNYWYLHDTPIKEGQNILKRYIEDAHEIFASAVSLLADFKRPFTDGDEKHLQSMLVLLIDARKTWEEESK